MANVTNIMLQGTSSHVGKSVLTAALIRCLKNRGFRVAPFKAQNMALNSAVAQDGGEIGRAQAMQAEAAGLAPSVHMNPILLKPTGDSQSQVIIQGRVFATMSAREYHAFKKEALKYVLESYSKLAETNDIIVIEGAGSPAEVNLRENDIANMGIAEAVESPVLLIGDIDRGGVFASIVGTLELLEYDERERIKGLIINKFRGDKALLDPGLEFLQNRTGKAVIGVVPYFTDLTLPDEDSVSLESRYDNRAGDSGKVKVAVVKLPRVSNFTDFDPFKDDANVEMSFITTPQEIEGADLLILPGTKSTLSDLFWMKTRGFGPAIKEHLARGGMVAGICGGFQMLGRAIKDPYGVETGPAEGSGLGLIEATTVLGKDKKTFEVAAVAKYRDKDYEVKGYEIHMGETIVKGQPFSKVLERNGKPGYFPDGAASVDGMVWGTYIHGIFDNDLFRGALLSSFNKGISTEARSFGDAKRDSLSSLATIFERNVDMAAVLKVIGV